MSNGQPLSLAQLTEGGCDRTIIETNIDELPSPPLPPSSTSYNTRADRLSTRTVIGSNSNKRPAGEKIAKDTGCCLYSAITVVAVMVVSLGILLIIAGPVLGFSLFPSSSLLGERETTLPLIEHNHLVANNQSDDGHLADVDDDSLTSHRYNDDTEQLTLPKSNATGVNDTVEDLSSLSPEALRINPKYVAYVPIAVKDDDDDDDSVGYDEDSAMEQDNASIGWIEEEDDDDTAMRASTSYGRRRQEGNDKVLLPIVMVPASEAGNSDAVKSAISNQDSWRHGGRYRESEPPRRFDEESSIEEASREHLMSSSSRRAPNQQRIPQYTTGTGAAAVDYRMFGNLSPERANRPRPSQYGGRPRDDFSRTTVLYPQRTPYRQRLANKRLESRNGPSRYIRPPPPGGRQRHRFQQRQPLSVPPPPVQQQVWNEPPAASRQRVSSPVNSKPVYTYPRDAMSIQDIISYMTSLGHSSEQLSSKSQQQHGGSRTGQWNQQDNQYQQQPSRPRNGQSRPLLSSSSSSSVSLSNGRQSDTSLPGRPTNPYSFKLDVYPLKEQQQNGGPVRNQQPSGSSSSFRQQAPVLQNFRQTANNYNSQKYQAQYYSRQKPQQQSSSLGDIDYSYKVHYLDDRTQNPVFL